MLLGALALAAGLGGLAGCRGDRSEKPPRQFFPDMDDSPKWKNQGETEFYADGRQMRKPPEHVVAFGAVSFDPESFAGEAWAEHWSSERKRQLAADDAYYRGVGPDGAFLPEIPESVDVTPALLERGRDRFDIYCAACHGIYGDGQGLVGVRWAVPVANLHDPKYTDPELDPEADQWRDGYIFHTILNGVGDTPDQLRMPAYGYALDERDAWAVVAYVRALQATGLTTPAIEQAKRAAAEAAEDAEDAGESNSGGGE